MKTIKIYRFVLCLVLIYIVPGQSLASQIPADAGIDYDMSTANQGSVTRVLPDKNSSDFMWLLGEVTLAILTSVLLLIIYSWHLRKVVEKKTLELKNFNIHLEDKIEKRTFALKKSREEYKAMYAHVQGERNRARMALKSERKAIRQNLNFIDMISHEYRTPLSVLNSSIEIIQKRCGIIEYHDLDDQFRKMKISIQRLIDIFELSLGKERIDNHSPQLLIRKLNLVQIIYSAIELASTAHINHQIIFNGVPNIIHITGDEKLLITVFSNILDNACKYCEPEKQIVITVTPIKNHIEIIIVDSGMGIDEDEAPFVFEKYFRSEHTGAIQGAGVGLFLVKKILELHKGEIKLNSQRNVGTQMAVILPIEKKASK